MNITVHDSKGHRIEIDAELIIIDDIGFVPQTLANLGLPARDLHVVQKSDGCGYKYISFSPMK